MEIFSFKWPTGAIYIKLTERSFYREYCIGKCLWSSFVYLLLYDCLLVLVTFLLFFCFILMKYMLFLYRLGWNKTEFYWYRWPSYQYRHWKTPFIQNWTPKRMALIPWWLCPWNPQTKRCSVKVSIFCKLFSVLLFIMYCSHITRFAIPFFIYLGFGFGRW